MEEVALDIIRKVFLSVFSSEVGDTLDEIFEKYAFDKKLPYKVFDSTTGEVTWADSIHNDKYITNHNMEVKDDVEGWMLPKRSVDSLDDVIRIWNTINFTTTERNYDSSEVFCSDTIYRCQRVFRSSNCSDSSHLVFCDSCGASEFLVASSRSGNCNFCIRVDDSKNCSNSYQVVCSNKISHSFFIQDCFDLYECMFCSHISSKRFCIANMQFSEKEYYEIKKVVIDWIMNS